MALTCKNCGGTVSLDENTLICDSCGMSQQLSTVLSDNCDRYIYKEELSEEELDNYKKALSLMSSAKTENVFILAAKLFEQIPGLLNSDNLAQECREKAKLIKTERIYNTALLSMESEYPLKIENAINSFKSLGDYKDAALKADECLPLLNIAKIKYEEKLKIEEEQQRAKKIKGKILSFVVIILTFLIIIGYFFVYSPSNIKISLLPNQNNFITEKYNSYIFNFDAKIQNNGFIDVRNIEGNIIFEKDNEILVDTKINFYNYSSAVVRAHKSSKYNWELKIYSYDTALILYETDFHDLDVKIKITSITYTNGKTKTY